MGVLMCQSRQWYQPQQPDATVSDRTVKLDVDVEQCPITRHLNVPELVLQNFTLIDTPYFTVHYSTHLEQSFFISHSSRIRSSAYNHRLSVKRPFLRTPKARSEWQSYRNGA